MQGLYRFLLAATVVVHHLAKDYAYYAGNFAVLAFYALSAYLITGALSTNYGRSFSDLKRFATNRFLRLMPAYWMILAIAIFGVLTFPAAMEATNPSMRNPGEFTIFGLPAGWIPQFTMVGLQMPPGLLFPIRLIPPAWSTSIEFVFYFLLAAAAFLTDRRFWWVVLATAILGIACAMTDQMRWSYTSLAGVSFLFAAGSLVWRHRDAVEAALVAKPYLPVAILALFLIIAFMPEMTDRARVESYLVWGQYAAAPLVALLAHASVTSAKLIPKKLDSWLADMSYPVFLSHYPIAGIVRGIGFSGSDWLVISMLGTLVVSALVVLLVEHPLQGLRRRIRSA